MRMRGNLLNGITSRQRRVTSDDAANPRPTLTNGHARTNAGSGWAPGGAALYESLDAPSFWPVESRFHRVRPLTND